MSEPVPIKRRRWRHLFGCGSNYPARVEGYGLRCRICGRWNGVEP